MSTRGRGLIGVVLATSALFTTSPTVDAAECLTSSDSAGLDEFFRADDAAGLAGSDYPHAIALPDGRTLWYFQDTFFGSGSKLTDASFAHNAALVQDGDCFERLVAPGGDGNSWIGSWVETDLQNWLWPLDAEVGADGHLWLFLAEMQNENGDGAARGALPVGTWVARYSLPDLQLVDMELAPDPSRSLFGYSIVSDPEFSYLFGHCYRQFDEAGLIGFDPDCSPHAYLARVPVGEFGEDLEYWTDSGWSRNRDERIPVMTSEISMPVSVQRFGDVYVSASIEGDWFGEDVVVSLASTPQGPWFEATRYTPETGCGEGCNNYGAFVLPELEGDRVVIAQSNNAYDMRYSFELASLYRPDVRAVDVPGVSAANLTRSPNMVLARAEPEPEPVPEPTVTVPEPPTEEVVTVDPVVQVQDPTLAARLRTTPADTVRHAASLGALGVLLAGIALWAPIGLLTLVRSIRRTRPRRRQVLARLSVTPAH